LYKRAKNMVLVVVGILEYKEMFKINLENHIPNTCCHLAVKIW